MSAYEAASGKPLTVVQPSASPTPQFYPTPATLGSVTLNTTTPGAEIHYTLDGSLPTSISPIYTTPLTIDTTTTVKAKAIKAGFPDSSIMEGTYSIGTRPPRIAISTYDSTGAKKIIPVSGTYTSPFDIDAVYQYYTPIYGENENSLLFHFGVTVDGTLPTIGTTAAPTDLMADGVSFLTGVYRNSQLLTLVGNDAQANIVNYASYSGWADSSLVSTHIQVHYTGDMVVNAGDPVTLNLAVSGNSGTDPVVSAQPYLGSTQIAYNAFSQVAWYVNGAQVTSTMSPTSTSYFFHIKNSSSFPAGTYNITCTVQTGSGTYSKSIQGIVYAP